MSAAQAWDDASVHNRHAIAATGRNRFLVAAAVLALLASIPAATVGAVSSPAAPSTSAAGATGGGVSDSAAQPLGSQTSRPAARPNPDQVPLVDHAGTGTGARLVLSAPKSVAVGQTITIALKAAGVKNLAGYQGVLRFDTAAAEFDGLTQRSVALAGSGRDVQPLGPVDVLAGEAFGLYSCPIAGCGATSSVTAPTRHPGASGNVALAKFTLIPTVAGDLSIGLGSLRFVDSAGKPLTLSLPGSVTVKVGTGGSAHPAPAAQAETTGTAQAATSLDLSGDGLVGPADLNLAAHAWGNAQADGTSCALADPSADVNHDGCLNVSDLQLIAAQVVPAPAAPDLGRFAEPAVAGLFTVDSIADTVDKTPGDGICATAANVCTLRAAIQEANLHAGADTINFNIAGVGVPTITLSGTLPTITDMTGPVTIDGYSQPGASPNTGPTIDNAAIEIQITSSAANNCTANPVSPH
ncbi:MAG: CSLREA domain-containing protein, partial [Candidatus Limnocylindrales bacterium]